MIFTSRTDKNVVSKQRNSPWLWIPSLCAAEEIPMAVVMYVALIMLMQFGASELMSSFYVAMLFFPWVMKSYLYNMVRRSGSFKRNLHVVESLLFLCLMGIAVYISEAKVTVSLLFLQLLVLSCLCAWHELLSRLYYIRVLSLHLQPIFLNTKMLSSQVVLVVTYGILIIVAGFFEVFFRSYQKAWAMESSLVAGGFLLLLVLNIIFLPSPRINDRYRPETLSHTVKKELHVLSRIQQKPHVFAMLLSLFLLLLPQALMFNTRVFFLFASTEEGGLGCSVQDVGFAQGTIGVLAFSIGITLGHYLSRKHSDQSLFWPTAIVLTLSPLSYMLMAHYPQPDQMFLLCCTTFFAQFCFGFGLTVCRSFVVYISEQRYRYTTNLLYVPMVASLMIVPMAVSGWLCQVLGYPLFFTLTASLAPVAWLVVALSKTKERLLKKEQKK